MQYIVLDLEWNQAMDSNSPVYSRLPIHLRGEIIQIGAVKLNSDFTPGDEFQIDVRPVYFRKIHYKVKKLTGFDSERLKAGVPFKIAMERFREWCGDGCTFLTWGYDDKGIFEQNIIIHDLDWDWISGWINLQLIYNSQTDGDRNQKALHTAMEHFGIEQTRVAHDALGDAYNTALVCSHLDIISGLERYDEISRRLALKSSHPAGASEQNVPDPLEHLSFGGYANRSDALDDPELTKLICPECGRALSSKRWINQGDKRYMTLAACPEHGNYLVCLKFRRGVDELWAVNRITYKAEPHMEEIYNSKASAGRRRKRRSRRNKLKSRSKPQ